MMPAESFLIGSLQLISSPDPHLLPRYQASGRTNRCWVLDFLGHSCGHTLTNHASILYSHVSSRKEPRWWEMVQRKNDIWEASPTTPVTNTVHHNSLLQIYLGGPGKCGKKKIWLATSSFRPYHQTSAKFTRKWGPITSYERGCNPVKPICKAIYRGYNQ